MPKFKFIPNNFACKKFNLAAKSYFGDGMTPLLEKVLGKDNYNRYMIAQDPLCGKGLNEAGELRIVLNREEFDIKKMNLSVLKYEGIGSIARVK